MNAKTNFSKWLERQQSHAALDAPPAPRGFELLDRVRPWWERWPERFRALAEPLAAMEVHYGRAASGDDPKREGYPVPTVIVRTQAEDRGLARILYFSIADRRLRLRFQMGPDDAVPPENAEVTFVDAASSRPLFAVALEPASGGRFRVEAELTSELAEAWKAFKVTDRMPFHLIIQQASS